MLNIHKVEYKWMIENVFRNVAISYTHRLPGVRRSTETESVCRLLPSTEEQQLRVTRVITVSTHHHCSSGNIT